MCNASRRKHGADRKLVAQRQSCRGIQAPQAENGRETRCIRDSDVNQAEQTINGIAPMQLDRALLERRVIERTDFEDLLDAR